MTSVSMMRSYGGSEVLKLEDAALPLMGDHDLHVRQTAIGVNFHDIYVRSGIYDTLVPPGVLGCEAAGVVEAVGSGVKDFKSGDRVAYVTGPPYGAYASERILPSNAAVHLPHTISDELAAGNLLRALTVEMLTRQVAEVHPDMTILVHAAAGGVGRLLCKMASHIGATVIGTVGSAEKAAIAKDMGCSHTILYREVDFAKAVMEITGGHGVQIVYDSIGADTFERSLAVLSMCGHLVNFGQSSGNSDPIAMATLAQKSLTVSRPILFHYLANRTTYETMAAQVFEDFANGVLDATAPQTFALADAGSAHDLLASRSATSPIILVP